MSNNPQNETEWQSLLYRLMKEFDPRYVLRDGVNSLSNILVFGMAGFILTAFLAGLAALAFGKIHLGL